MSSGLTNLAKEIRSDLVSGKLVAALSAGGTAGLGLLVAQIAFATFIFSGPLSSYSSQGVGLVLFGNFAACLTLALAGGYRGVIAGLSPALVIGMAAFGSAMDAQGEELFVTVCGALVLTAVFVGVSCLLVGRFGFANLLRFVPYPVSAGFVAGIGGAVCLAAMSLMGSPVTWSGIGGLFESAALWRWGPGVVFGIGLYFAMKQWGNPLIVPISVVMAVIAYHIALTGLDISGEEARSTGLLLTSTAEGNLWPAIGIADLAHMNWSALGSQIPNMLVLVVVAFICVILNLAGLEVATGQELDWDREFLAGGGATVVAGIGGGMVATIVVPASLRSKLFGATTRLTGVFASLVIGAALFVGDGMLELIPSPLIGGVLVFAGLGMLDEGLVKSRRQLPLSEFAIVALIFVAIVVFGLMEGVGTGILATLVFFVVRLSRVDVIESSFTARDRRSSKVRPAPERAVLFDRGVHLQAYKLRGYVFFGSVTLLAARLRALLGEQSRPDCLLLDFADVSGFDYSAVNVLGRFLQEAERTGVQVVLSAVPESLNAGLSRSVPSTTLERLSWEANTDLALERCEEVLIANWRENLTDLERGELLEKSADDLERDLEHQIDFEELTEKLHGWLDVHEHSSGDNLVGNDDSNKDLQLLVSGRVSGIDNSGNRLFQLSAGDVVSPISRQNADVVKIVAEQPCRTVVLTGESQNWLEANRKDLALRLYRYILEDRFQLNR